MSSLPFTEWRQYINLEKQVRDLEKQQRHAAGSVSNWDAQEYTVHPTCPPSTSVVVIGGRYSFTPNSPPSYCRWTKDSVFDFVEDADDVYAYWPYTCVHTNWYVPIYFTLGWYGDYTRYTDGITDNPQFAIFGADYQSFYGGGFVEYETTAEAEYAIDGLNPDFHQDHIRETSIPLCRMVLRISEPGVNKFMPIDMVNRGRSYFWGQFRDGRLNN